MVWKLDNEIKFKIRKINNGYIVIVEHDVLYLNEKYFSNIEDILSLIQNDLKSMY